MVNGSIFDELEQRLDEIRRDLFGRMPESGMIGRGARTPAVDVLDEENEFVVAAELPGVRKEDIHLDVEESLVRIRAKRFSEEERAQRGYLRRERSEEAFERVIPLPEEVSPEGARARFNNGVLEIMLPKKSPEARRARHVEIE